MRRVDLKEWKKQRSLVFETMIRTDNSFEGRATGKRPRDPEKERILSALDIARWQRWIGTGRIEVLGPRRYRLNVERSRLSADN